MAHCFKQKSVFLRLILGLVFNASMVASPEVLFSLSAGGGEYSVSRMFSHPVHGLFVIGTFQSSTPNGLVASSSFLVRFSHAGRRLWTVSPLRDVYLPHGLTVDESGTAYVVGRSALSVSGPSFAAVVLVADNGLQLQSQRLGGNRDSEAWDVAVGANGDYTITGQTQATDFPTTPGVIMPSIEQPDSFGSSNFAFVTRFSREHRLVFSTYLGGYKTNCVGGSSCIGAVGQTIGYAVRLDRSGNSYLTGFTNATDFPVTTGTPVREGFAAKLNATATQLLYSLHTPVANSDGAMHLSTSGEITAAGNERQNSGSSFRGLVYRLSQSGDSYTYLSYLSDGFSEIRGLAADAQENIWVSGGGVSGTFPDTEDSFPRGSNFLMKLCSSACAGFRSARLPQGMADRGLAIAGDRIFVAGASVFGVSAPVSALRLDGPKPALYGISNGVRGPVKSYITIGEIVSLFGTAIGPDEPQSGQPDSAGFYPASLAGTELRFDGYPAPIFYGQSDQLNGVVPLALAGKARTVMELFRNGALVASRDLEIQVAAPVFFQTSTAFASPSVALNEDGTMNSRQNPAPRGSIVSLFATGFGPVAPQPSDGSVTREPFPQVTLPVSASFGEQRLEILYAGYAPGLIAGVVQVNLRLPDSGFGPNPAPVNTYFLPFVVADHSANAIVWIRY